MKRTRSLHGSGAGALTPALPIAGGSNLRCQRCQDKENYIVKLQAQIERQQKVIRDQSDEMLKKQNFIEKLKGVFRGEQETLKPSPTRRPAQKGNL